MPPLAPLSQPNQEKALAMEKTMPISRTEARGRGGEAGGRGLVLHEASEALTPVPLLHRPPACRIVKHIVQSDY
jgi:hypothetical protein